MVSIAHRAVIDSTDDVRIIRPKSGKELLIINH